MKRLVFIFAFLLCCSAIQVQARGIMTMCGAGMPVAGCTTPSGTVLSESFGDGGTDTDATWATSGDSYTYKHELQASSPAGSCTYGLLHDTANESGERVYWDNGSGIDYSNTNVTIEFSLYVNSFTIDNSANIIFMSWATANAGSINNTITVRFYKTSGGALQLFAGGASNSTFVGISTETWYTVKIHINTTAASSYFQVTGGGSTTCDTANECKFSRSDQSGRYLVIGSLNGEGAAEAISYEIGYVTVN